MTTELGSALREISEAADSGQLAPPALVRARGGQRRRRARGVSAAVALATSVLAVGSLRGAPQSAPGPLGPGPTQPTKTSFGPVKAYRISAQGEMFRPLAIAADETTFVVAGAANLSQGSGSSIYWSDDGATWAAPTELGPGPVRVADVIHSDDGFVAVGADDQGPAAWRSDDGRAWVEARSPDGSAGGRVTLTSVTATSLGYFTWGRGGDSWLVWRSDDGTAWTPIADPEAFHLTGDQTICSLQEHQGGLRAIQLMWPHGALDKVEKVFWESKDGETWTMVDRYPTSGGCYPDEVINHMQADSAAGSATIYPDPGEDKVYLRHANP